MPSQKKIQIVSSLLEDLKKSPNFVIVGFEDLPHLKFEELRRSLKNESSLQVIKNSLLKVAVAKMKKTAVLKEELLKGKSAVLTLPTDWTTGLSIFYKFSKGDGGLAFKIGMIDDKVYEKNELIKLAELPSREELAIKIIRSLRSPQTRFVYAMKFNMMKLIYILKNTKGVN